MIRFDLATAARITGGRAVGEAATFEGVAIDSRTVRPGQLFCALPGEQVDGHAFVSAAARSGAAAALVAREVEAALPQLVVDDVAGALGRLAAAWRESLDVTVVGITGSNGKTTVKNLVAGVLGRVGPTLATEGNLNNELGVPLTLARLDDAHRFAVIEMGCGQPGDIEYLARLARPTVGIVTNAGPAHLERLGSVEGVARCKGELFETVGELRGAAGHVIVNRDDPFCAAWIERAGNARVLSFGRDASADIQLIEGDGAPRLETPAGTIELHLALPGAHNRANAAAAAAAALALDVPTATVEAGLAAVHGVPGRLDVRHMTGGWTLIDDTYNANPASLYAALAVLAEQPGERWLVLGDMAELGEDSEKLHAEVGSAAAEFGVTRLYATGPNATRAAVAFGAGGAAFDSTGTLAAALSEAVHDGVVCLVKGSRSAHMEDVIARLIDRQATGEGEAC
ncbi:UDP-N-acetylmuramoyl-tripeptide--D-alanyl-D-alanine ligase [Wenzhouxiangella sp. XN79A]|uniref:UDP-N-acetylmuramoyl-tripeptide--D-alanyl-D- alanine ligase n=1 Tax=Wenzhouxiangella sp. XN79A TaxID=2724193 RepID=UPI00144A4F95|nr:UDP-N-acetylmuramoyl-tripeptide--D-alanyl-D-alanine ligase [Wenzhouxiangella sp. XN79A]NKI34331.1 UDP-N-acetylmuramoyl-tripeptide--D-alanyl-D-alanine ligase [Wenzhouxiangella sp. XN79A]